MSNKKDEYLEILKLFNAKVDRLRQSLFLQYIMREKKFSVNLSAKRGEQVEVKTRLPSQQEIGEFVLTFRFFIQDNERCSMRNLRKLYETMPISSKLKTEFLKLSDNLNKLLDSEPQSIKINVDKEPLTNRRIMEVFIYGDLAHANAEKAKVFAEWKRNPLFFSFLEFQFNNILEAVLRALGYAKQLNENAIAELS